ncbi:MAG: GLPGLI family protein [Gelidibacter sp.]
MKLINYIILSIFITSFFIRSNNEKLSGEVEYGFLPNNVSQEEKQNSKELYDVLDKMNEAASGLTFILKFNLNESFFELNPQMESDIKPMGIAYAKNMISKGKYYFNKKKDELLREANLYDNYTLIKSIPSQSKWTLYQDTKKIDKYLCYKATKIKTVTNNLGDHHFVIEAWYTPEIPVPFGPNEFNSLPGLILELKDASFTFYAKKVSIDKSKSAVINHLESKNIITEEKNNQNFFKLRKN